MALTRMIWLSAISAVLAWIHTAEREVKESRLSNRSENYLRRTPQTRFPVLPPPPC